MTYQLPHWVWPVALMLVGAVAVRRGGNEERLAAAVVLADWALSMTVYKARSQETQWAVLAVDACQFAVLLWIGLRSARWWPLFAGGFALLQLVTHLAHAVDPRVGGWAYITAARVWSYSLLFAIGYGAWTAPRRAEDRPASAPDLSR